MRNHDFSSAEPYNVTSAHFAPGRNKRQHAETLLRRLRETGGRVRRQAGRVALVREAGGTVAEYSPHALDVLLEDGAVEEHRRRDTGSPHTSFVEYRLAAVAPEPEPAPLAKAPASREPVTRRTTRKRRKAAPKPPADPVDDVLAPTPDGHERVTVLQAVERWKRSRSVVHRAIERGDLDKGDDEPNPRGGRARVTIAMTPKSRAYVARVWEGGGGASPEATAKAATEAAPKKTRAPRRRRAGDVPTAPAPLADGTPCVSRDALAGRFGVPEATVATAAQRGHLDIGGEYRPLGRPGANSVGVALTARTLAYAEDHWRREPTAVALPPEGTEVNLRELTALLGYAERPPVRRVRAIDAAAPWRYVNPANHRRGKLYRVGPELVAVLEGLGYEVTVEPLAKGTASGDGAAHPTAALAVPLRDGHWGDLLDRPFHVTTPVL